MCIVMKRYKGSLEDRLQQQDGPLPLPEVLVLMLHVARALAGLHAAEIRVQDLKPGNILLDKEGQPHISDFGIAAIEGATKATSVGGTSNYTCAEMFSTDDLTVKVDIWDKDSCEACAAGQATLWREQLCASFSGVPALTIPSVCCAEECGGDCGNDSAHCADPATAAECCGTIILAANAPCVNTNLAGAAPCVLSAEQMTHECEDCRAGKKISLLILLYRRKQQGPFDCF